MNRLLLLTGTALAAGLALASPAYSGPTAACVDGAPGANSTECGTGSTTGTALSATAVGVGSQATADYTTAVGESAQATAVGATAAGQFATAEDPYAVAVGYWSWAEGQDSTAVGDFAHADGVGATATGANAWADGDSATALGQDSYAIAGSTALGAGAEANGLNSVALGAGSVADEDDVVSVGDVGAERRIVNVDDATNATDAVNLRQMQAADTTLQNNINSEATLRGNADTTLQNNINSEATLRGNADATLQNNINSEATLRGNADTTLQNNINSEATLRANADTALDQSLDALEGIALDFGDQLDKVDRRASAGTATAIALSGNSFLPGKSFNLTGNVGTYRGAVAMALQLGALVGENVALNAGVAKSLNKSGKLGARAGFTVGW